MGREFGKLEKIKGINYYVVSPYEQNPLKGLLNPGFMNFARRIRGNFFFATIPALFCYIVYDTATKMNIQSKRKNPDDYKDDE